MLRIRTLLSVTWILLFAPAALCTPTAPVVTDDGATTTHFQRLHAVWSATDPSGTISRYEYAIGIAPYPEPGWNSETGGFRNAGPATEVTATDVILSQGRQYFVSVRAVNTANQTGPTGVSDGIVLALPSAQKFTTMADFGLGELSSLVADPPDQLRLGLVSQTEPYIWIANHTLGRVTKIDTRTGAILAQYYSTLPQNQVLPDNLSGQTAIPAQGSNLQSPSRTAVDLDGNVYVANRAHVSSNQQGSLTKIAGSRAYAVDRNGNGRIDTSSGLNEVLSEDESVLWTAKVGKPGTIARGVAVDAENNVWVGTFTDAILYRFNGQTGELMESINLKTETGQSAVQIYGIAIGRDGCIYSTSIDAKWAVRTDPKAPVGSRCKAVQTYLGGYGIAVDRDGNQWIGRWQDNAGGDVNLQRINWSRDPVTIDYLVSPYGGRTRGVAVDGDGNVWGAQFDSNRLLKFSPEGYYIASYPVAAGPIGVAVDSEGRIWAVGGSSNTCTRIDPVTGERLDVSAGGEPYSYSDMTGFQLRNFAARQGYWTAACDAGSYGATWHGVSWTGEEPDGTLLKFEVRAAETTVGLDAAPWRAAENGAALEGLVGRYLQVKATLRVISGDATPVLYDVTIDAPTPGPGSVPEMTIAGGKQIADDVVIRFANKKVTFTGGGFFYIEEPQRFAGIRVNCPDKVYVGDSVTVIGRTGTVGYERQLVSAALVSGAAGDPLGPVYMSLSKVGGAAFGWQPGTGNAGLNNTGLLVMVSGRVIGSDAGYLYLDDGSVTGEGLRVPQGSLTAGLVATDWVQYKGISSVAEVGGEIRPCVIPAEMAAASGGDEFDSAVLSPYWSFIRPDANYWSLTSDPGFLKLMTTGTDLWQSTNNLKNLLLRPIPDTSWSIETIVHGAPVENYQQGGILAYQNDDNYMRFEFQYANERHLAAVKEIGGGTSGPGSVNMTGIETVQMRIDRTGNIYTLYWKLPASQSWAKLADVTDVPLTNVRVGLFALKGSGIGEPFIPMTFDYFRWRKQ